MRRLLAHIAFSCFAAGLLTFNTSAQGVSNHLTVSQWVQPAVAGEFSARVIAPLEGGGGILLPKARVLLLGRGGLRHEGYTDMNGEVVIPNVTPGLYTVTARAKGWFACYALHVLGAEEAQGNNYPSTIEISCAATTFRRFESTVMPYAFDQRNRDEMTIDTATAAEIHSHVRGNESHQVARAENGFVGHLYGATKWDPAVNANVFLMKNGGNPMREVTDEQGRFEFKDLDSGVYSLITVGPDGMGAVGFELTNAPAQGNVNLTSENGYRLVKMQNGESGGFAMQVSPVTPDELEEVGQPLPGEEETETEETPGEEIIMVDEFPVGDPLPLADGTVAPGNQGFGGTGSGTGTGGGGVGAVVAGAVIGGAIIAATDDDDAASPFVPAN